MTAIQPTLAQETFVLAWLPQLLTNVFGYLSVIIPGYLFILYIQRSGYLSKKADGFLFRAVRLLVHGHEESVASGVVELESSQRTLRHQILLIVFCSSGLLTSYLVWGLVQERIMAIEYTSADGQREHFRDSLFLEFVNRFLAVFIACVLMLIKKQPVHTAPVYKYSFNALSNVMSSWCQYEALKYVSFPIQVLAKAAKVIPVMLMGRLVSRQSYSLMEYLTGGMISLGLFMFVVSTDKMDQSTNHATYTISGIILLAGYLAFDAFTSNWQSNLFRVYHMSSIQMMAGSNLFSILLAGVSLIEQGGFVEALSFISRYPVFISHIICLSITSAAGQLFIYYTIEKFGAVTFTIIMTVRQGFAIVLSCIVYKHSVQIYGVVGVTMCFGAIFIRIFHAHSVHVAKHPRHTVITRQS